MRSENLSPEWRLLLRLAHSPSLDRTDSPDSSLPDSFDWMRFYRLAEMNDVLPLLRRPLNDRFRDRISDEAYEAFSNYQMKLAIHQRIHFEELIRIQALFKQEGIASVAFKGPAFGCLAYGDPSLRDFEDLDLLVRESQVKSASHLLRDNGYRPLIPLEAFDEDRSFKRWMKNRKEIQFARNDERASIDLHWRATNFLSDAMNDRLWDRVTEIRLLDHPILTFDLETALLHACIHGSRHAWSDLKWICDVAEAMERLPEGAFGRLKEESRRYGAERRVGIGLGLAAHLLGATIPDEWRSEISLDRKNRWLIRQCAEWLLSEKSFLYFKFFFRALSTDNPLDIFLQINEYAQPNEKDVAWIKLPKSLAPAIYLLRPLRILVTRLRKPSRR